MNDFERISAVAGGVQPLLERTGESPAVFAARLVGLGRDELRAGIPKWGWAGIGLVVGASLMWAWGDQIKRAVRAR